MKSKTRLDSAVFQLTPTRTRCDLVINANGVSEKIASGLLTPFLAHLKCAQDQIAKGGYSITLEPKKGSDDGWFTKGTMERFVRFVSTPEVLERVSTIESEILQIEESIAMQSNENLVLAAQLDDHQNKVGDHQTKSLESNEGTKPVQDTDTEKAIVLYQPEAHLPESNGSTGRAENSKVQLLKVLETRRVVLQKEQGMAFARAVAAGFELDHIDHLISFSECFEALRLMDACLRFVQLWKEKHETGQWLEIDSAETMSNRSDFSSMIAPGTTMSFETKKPSDVREVWPQTPTQLSSDTGAGQTPPPDAQVPPGNHVYIQGQYQHPMFSQWPIHSPSGAPPVYQPYPGMPYYQNYPGSGPFFQPPYPPTEDPRFNSSQRVGLRRESMDGTESESAEMGHSNGRYDVSDLENEGSHDRRRGKKSAHSSKKQAGTVVIRNINYITSKKQSSSGSESESASDPESDDYSGDLKSNSQEVKRKKSRSSNGGTKISSSSNVSNPYGKDEGEYGRETNGENWQAFQSFLLRNEDKDTHNTDQHMFSMEKEAQGTQRRNITGSDPIVPRRLDLSEVHDGRTIGLDSGTNLTRVFKVSGEEFVTFGQGSSGDYNEYQVNMQSTELGVRGGYRRGPDDDFMIHRRENHSGRDGLPRNELENASDNWDKRSSHNMIDESFVVPVRSGTQDQSGTGSRTALDMDVEFPSDLQNTEDLSSKIRSQISYEPDDLSMMPERGRERESIGYDPAIDYEMQAHAANATKVASDNQDDVVSNVNEEENKLVKGKKVRGKDILEKRKTDTVARKGMPSKFSPSAEAQARAAKLRAYKADLQKMKKEKEDEEIKRLEALKRERQKRIAGRGNASPAQLQHPSPQNKPRLPTKLSPNAHRGSKFADSEPGSSSPLQKLPARAASMGSHESKVINKPSKFNNSGRMAPTGLSRSVSSLPELKKDKDINTPEPKISTARLRRLSEPKASPVNHAASVKLRSTDSAPKSKVSNGPEIKKISAIISLDKTKAATLPELKIRTTKEPSDLSQGKSAVKEVTQKASGTNPSVTSVSSKVKKNNAGSLHDLKVDDNLIVEKAVVVLKCETSPTPSIQRPEEKMELREVPEEAGAKTDTVYQYTTTPIRAPVAPQPMGQFNNQPSFHEVKADKTEPELSQHISAISIEEKLPYRAPHARASSMVDLDTTKVEYSTTPKDNMEASYVVVSESRDPNLLEESPESSGKTQGKEHSKGFKRLLKFGKKSVSSSDKVSASDSMSDNHSSSSATNDVNTLKNLLSQDETPTATTAQKASRHFSLLSPFRSKTSEKKVTT
ncbi:hypothetical protein ACHQM5_014133 [Ranunculus cassubicifolius]